MTIVKKSAYLATVLAVISGIISVYWALGGTTGLRSIGGQVEALAQKGGTMPIFFALGTACIKFAGAFFALAFVQPWGRRIPETLLQSLGWIVGVGLTTYGLLNVVVGSLVLAGVLHAPQADRYALKWHVFCWDAYFAVWGVALLIVVYGFRSGRVHSA